MREETAYHKLKDTSHFELIEKDGFTQSTPDEIHWLSSGIYFFLDPNGLRWATKWPFSGDRQNKSDGIIITTIETTQALDLRSKEHMSLLRDIVSRIRAAVTKKGQKYTDGRAIGMITSGPFSKMLGFVPTAIIANFDTRIELRGKYPGSNVLLRPNWVLPPYSETTQIQACVKERSIIRALSLHKD